MDNNNRKDDNNNTSKQVLLSVLGVAILIVAVVGISFAAFSYSKKGTVENTITTGTISMAYNEDSNGINIEDAIPLTDAQGKALTGEGNVFDFSVTATITGKTTINYEVVASKDASSTVPDEHIRLYLESSDTNGSGYTQVFAPAAYVPSTTVSSMDAPIGTMQMTTGSFTSSSTTTTTQTKYYRLRMWVAESYPVSGDVETYKVYVNVYGKGTN